MHVLDALLNDCLNISCASPWTLLSDKTYRSLRGGVSGRFGYDHEIGKNWLAGLAAELEVRGHPFLSC
jgi:hypothetical protein